MYMYSAYFKTFNKYILLAPGGSEWVLQIYMEKRWYLKYQWHLLANKYDGIQKRIKIDHLL